MLDTLDLVRDRDRVGALRRYDILDAPAERAFDDIVRLASQICSTPVAAINLIDADRQFFIAEVGLGVRELPLSTSISIFALSEDDVLVVPDLAADPRYASRYDPRFRYYAGVALRTPDGHAIGALCVLDTLPRLLSAQQLDGLRALSRQVMTQLELRRTVEAQRKASLALRESEERFRAAFDHAVIGMVLIDGSGRVLRANPAFEHIVGRSSDELLGRDSRGYTHVDDQNANISWIRSVDTGEISHALFEKRYLRKDGEVVWARVHLSPVRDDDGGMHALVGIIEDITEARRTREELVGARRRLDSALIAGEVATYEWEMNSDRVRGDENFDNIFGVTLDANGTAPLARFLEAIHPDDRERVQASIARTIETHADYESEYRIVTRPAERWVIARGRITGDERDGTQRFHGVLLDITARKKLEQELERLLTSERAARSTAERASNMKDEFLATLSHELRTPLSAIFGWAQILSGGENDPAEIAEGISVIRRNAKAQAQIIEDLLEMSRIISGKVRLDVREIEITDVVNAAIETVRPAAAAKGLEIRAACARPERRITGDADRLQQVFWNLLSNAVKFTPKEGRVEVGLEDKVSHIEVVVSDTGEGIRPEFLPYVFDRFRQADSTTTRRHGGLGLGLAIVKQLVELHGGWIRVASDGEGRGAKFTVTLPLIATTSETAAGEEPITANRSLLPVADMSDRIRGLRILLVDDEADAREVTKRILEECGAIVTTASSAAAALAVLDSNPIDVLVSDIGMPGEDGYSLIRKAHERDGSLPALALTAYARPEDRTKALEAGYDAYLTKPMEPAHLIATVATLAGRA